MASRLDVVLFGVTGLVGKYSLEYLHKFGEKTKITYGVAGRNQKKIQEILDKFAEETGDKYFSNIPILYGDMSDQDSLIKMTSKTNIVINACGPLTGIGEGVVKACVTSKTHYLDVSAEENFVNTILIKYSEEAKEAGVYIINACGWNSMCFELGLLYLQKKFPGTLNSVESFIRTGNLDNHMKTYAGNPSTLKSMIGLQVHKGELKHLRKQLRSYCSLSTTLKPALPCRKLPFHPSHEDGWAVNLASTDKAVASRTQEYLHKIGKISRPVQVENYVVLESLWYLPAFIVYGLIFFILVQFEAGRRLLMKYPDFFSAGLITSGEVTRKMCENKWIRHTFVGKGWKDKLIDENCKEKPNHAMVVQLRGTNPAYGLTALCLVLSAVVLATEELKLPKQRGVLMPGTVFHETTIFDQLNDNGINFSIIDENEL